MNMEQGEKNKEGRVHFQLTKSTAFIFQISSFVLTRCTLWPSFSN